MTSVTYQGMVDYVDRRIYNLQDVIVRLTDQLDKHERWHTQLMAKELEGVRTARIAWWAVGVSLITAVGSVVVTLVTISGHA